VVHSSAGMTVRLRRQFLKLLDEDKEFRYTVAGYLGLGEILKRLDSIEENIRKIWEEIRGLREGQEKLWEGQNRLWEEVKALREGQEKLWDGQNKLWEEVKQLREGQNKLWEEVKALREGQEKLWEEVKLLREGQNKLWEGQNRLWEEVKALREGQEKLWASHRRLENYMRSAFGELRTALGVTYEMHAAAYLTMMLYEMGYEKAEVVSKSFVEDGEIVEVDLFNEEPLVVGEVTLAVKDVGDAEREVEKVMRRVGLVERVFGRRVFMAVLSVANLYPEAADTLKSLAARNGIRLILGREIKEALQL
jgi:regulator of replication initiation timing